MRSHRSLFLRPLQFKATLEHDPADQSLRDLSVDSVGGQPCQNTIDHARTFAVADHPDIINPLLERVGERRYVFAHGSVQVTVSRSKKDKARGDLSYAEAWFS